MVVPTHNWKLTFIAPILLLAMAFSSACAGGNADSPGTLYIGGIPDQETSLLVRRFDGLAHYLSDKLGVSVKYKASIDYAAVVTAFANGDLHLAWFGGLTGVQARKQSPGAKAIAQRPRDTEFVSAYIVQSDLPAQELQDLAGLTFTFGSINSTSGHLMPRHYLVQAGIDPDSDFNGLPNFSGSHNTTWKLVESGSFQAGALNKTVWENAVSGNRIDVSKVRQMSVTPPYFDYNWSARGDLDESFGVGFTQRLQDALLNMHLDSSQSDLLEAFRTDSFITSKNENYADIESVAKSLGMLE
jgi:phosphonate transport system substrate-binding protein